MQSLYLIDDRKGLTADEVVALRLFEMPPAGSILTPFDQKKSIERLSQKELLNFDGGPSVKRQKRRYHLSKSARSQIETQIASAENAVEKTVKSLFKNETIDFAIARDIFIRSVAAIFSELGEKYAKTIIGDGELAASLSQQRIDSIVSLQLRDDEKCYAPEMQRAVWKFLTDPSIQYAALKWNIAQNYYVAKCLGLDKSGRILSSEIFKNAKFYLDTNIVFSALETYGSAKSTFTTLADSCQQLGIKLRVAQPTIEEFSRVVTAQAEQIEKFGSKIPDSLVSKIRNSVFDAWHRKKHENPDMPMHVALQEYFDPLSVLANYGVELVDDKWFVSAPREPEIQKLAQDISDEYFRKRYKRKFHNAAMHDALLLSWIERERIDGHQPHWFVTLDTSLSEFEGRIVKAGERSLAVTVDAIIQWFSPMISFDKSSEKMADAFSTAIRLQLLPHENFFELSDFRIFSNIDIETQKLPAEDVEGCVRYIRAKAPTLDPTSAEDRERLTHEINRYFADPARRYLSDIARLEEMLEAQTQQNGDEAAQANAKLQQSENEKNELRKLLEVRDTLHRANVKILAVSVVGLALLILCTWTAHVYANGENFLQKIVNFWPLFGTASAATIGLIWWLLTSSEMTAFQGKLRHILKIGD